MGSVIYDKSMFLDGFMTGANVRQEAGLGDDGERLHDWAFQDDYGKELLEREIARLGAGICGRRTYDLSIPYRAADGPTGPTRVPLFIPTHRDSGDVPEGAVYTFVEDVETAFARARETAGDKNISVMGGTVGRQLFRAGLIDEIGVHLVPVLFGSGVPTTTSSTSTSRSSSSTGPRARTPRTCATASSATAKGGPRSRGEAARRAWRRAGDHGATPAGPGLAAPRGVGARPRP
jgi:dihydrofolate reductase